VSLSNSNSAFSNSLSLHLNLIALPLINQEANSQKMAKSLKNTDKPYF